MGTSACRRSWCRTWAEPSGSDPRGSSVGGPGLDDQYAVEAFYRVPIGDRFAVTADAQLIKDAALNPDESTLWLFNLRARFAF